MTSVTTEDLQALLARALAESGAVGAALAVIQGDELVETAAGVAHAEHGSPMTPDTLVQIGSTTKLFNAALVLTLVDDAVIELDEPVRSVLSDFTLADERASEIITVRQLLTMTSGMDNGPYLELGGADDERLARYVAAIREVPHLFSPGSAYAYSNAGTVVAGHAAERATRRGWDALLRERILEPAGLTQAATTPDELVLHRVSAGHDLDGTVLRPFYISRSLGPAGSTMAATAGDLVRFARLFLQDGAGVLSPAAVAEMTTPYVELPTRWMARRWCAGPSWSEWDGHVVLGHPGSNRSGTSRLYWIPDLDTAIASVCNTPAATGFMDAVIGPAATALGLRIPERDTPAPDATVEDAARYTGTYEMSTMTFVVRADGDSLRLEARGTQGPMDGLSLAAILSPLGGDRFVPQWSSAPGPPMDVAFFGDDGAGVATHFVNGVMAARRVR